MNIIVQPNGEILTGRVWRRQHSSFNRLPFYSNIFNMDNLAEPLKMSLSKDPVYESFVALLVVRYLFSIP
jgi:hypothetical protein